MTVMRAEVRSAVGRPTPVRFAERSIVVAAKGGDSSWRAAFARLPDWPEMAIWREWLRPGDLFVDVGANVGLYSLVAAECGARVIAIEPATDMVAQLRTNLRLNNLDEVEVHETAVLDRVGTVELLGPDANRRRAVVVSNGRGIRSSTLDAVVGGRSVRGLKIDVEGNERLVLEGAEQLLGTGGVQLIQLEWNDTSQVALGEDRGPLARILRTAGFELFRGTAGHVERIIDEVPGFGSDIFAARGDAGPFLQHQQWLKERLG